SRRTQYSSQVPMCQPLCRDFGGKWKARRQAAPAPSMRLQLEGNADRALDAARVPARLGTCILGAGEAEVVTEVAFETERVAEEDVRAQAAVERPARGGRGLERGGAL